MSPSSPKCPECGDKIAGRSDKKFCSDACRNAFNNKLNSDATNYVRNINNALRRNRRILQSLVPEEMAKASRQKLSDKGFNFTYYTHTHQTRKGTTYYFCYDYGYLPIENDIYLLVKRNEKG